MEKTQQRLIEMDQCEAKVITKRKCIILDRATLLEKNTKIPYLECFMWTQTKHNYDKHIERMENWKDIVVEED
jgi:hypothetical protein